jgi:hypothetical protein
MRESGSSSQIGLNMKTNETTNYESLQESRMLENKKNVVSS